MKEVVDFLRGRLREAEALVGDQSESGRAGDAETTLRLVDATRRVLRSHAPLTFGDSDGDVHCSYGVINGYGDLLREPWPCCTVEALATLWGWSD